MTAVDDVSDSDVVFMLMMVNGKDYFIHNHHVVHSGAKHVKGDLITQELQSSSF
jgi:hypothetical protein